MRPLQHGGHRTRLRPPDRRSPHQVRGIARDEQMVPEEQRPAAAPPVQQQRQRTGADIGVGEAPIPGGADGSRGPRLREASDRVRRLDRLRRRGAGRSRARGIVGGDPESLQARGDRLQGHLSGCRDDAVRATGLAAGQRRQRLVACDSGTEAREQLCGHRALPDRTVPGAYLGFSSDHAPEAELLRRFYYPPEWVARPDEHQSGDAIEYSTWTREREQF